MVVGFGSWWRVFGDILNLLGLWGRSWAVLGLLGGSCATLGSLVGGLKVLLEPLGSLLRALGPLPGALGSSLWVSWVALGRSWGFLEDLMGLLGCS